MACGNRPYVLGDKSDKMHKQKPRRSLRGFVVKCPETLPGSDNNFPSKRSDQKIVYDIFKIEISPLSGDYKCLKHHHVISAANAASAIPHMISFLGAVVGSCGYYGNFFDISFVLSRIHKAVPQRSTLFCGKFCR